MTFSLLSPQQWEFGDRVGAEQLARLRQPLGYEEIVNRLVPLLSVHKRCLEPREDTAGISRVALELMGPANIVELWYSGCGGYRAQYHLEEQVGDAANYLIADRILEFLGPQLQDWLSSESPPHLKLLRPTATKVWIKEGAWYHRARKIDIPSSVIKTPTPSYVCRKRAAKLRLKGGATPSDENRIVLKGPWIDSDGFEHPELAKRHRALEIRSFRFT